LHAYTKTISDLFSVKKKYVVPRFQREYSWEKEAIVALWDDVFSNIKVVERKCTNQEYFIGALVLIGEDKTFEMQIVDGQQRLTTITILLSALVETFKKIGKDKIASSIYENYIEGKDDESNPYFKLINETPKPFFQTGIQAYKKVASKKELTEEEKTLNDCYDEYIKKLEKKDVFKNLYDYKLVEASNDDDRYYRILLSIRDQILNYLKVIYVTVSEEEDAYTIFETLNARGVNLSAVDLIKNDIFRNLKDKHPDDTAKTKWKNIRTHLSSREDKINVDTFFRHFWLSKYTFTSEDRIYRTFKRLSKQNTINPDVFLEDLVTSSIVYNKIANPLEIDWKKQEEKVIFEKLLAFKLFKVTQVRSLVMAIIDLRESKKVQLTEMVNFLEKLENFHFIFTAICSSRSSGLEAKYSKTSRELRDAKKNSDVIKILNSLVSFLQKKLPSITTFTEDLAMLSYQPDRTLIQYIFRKEESYYRKTKELKTDFITLEHIASKKSLLKNRNSIGNLLPLDQALNSNSENKELAGKIQFYKKSELSVVKEFLKQYNQAKWTDSDIENRTKKLAKFYYENVWKM
jgi:uncharacterized protein with ParB-like and HNH nuclease domain